MNNSSEQEIKVIKKNDPLFPEAFQFETLRKKGLEYLGKLSGKLWTDHNVHDPGITMLEMLCYALMDLHYRTQLPIEDLLAPGDKTRPEDNFFTPAQILSCNPVTITDFRKALIDVPGVRNAWLEIADEGEIPLLIDCGNNEEGDILQSRLRCLGSDDVEVEEKYRVKLNGLYKVYIEPDKDNPYCTEGGGNDFDYKGLEKRVWETLHKYRNLCEDFLSVEILCEESVAVCLEIEVEDNIPPDTIYLDVLRAIDQFLSPRLQFYTLQELLEKGVTIEDAFAGRPYAQESHGFIDTADLENLERIKEIHLSDLYTVINQVPGVKGVSKLQIKGFYPNGDEHVPPSTECKEWIFQVAKDHVPRLCFDRSCITLYKESSRLKVDLEKVRKLFGETLLAYQTLPYNLASGYLDLPIKYGSYRSDLPDYYSIQNEFPKVYGIGEGGLSEEVSILRKAQARQLKGYLLFYDNLLAGYLSQLSNLRALFSMSPDNHLPMRLPAEEHTYFSQSLDTVPDIELLLRFYTEGFATTFGWSEGAALVVPIAESALNQAFDQLLSSPYHFGSVAERDAAIQQYIRAFGQGDMSTEVIEDPCGYYFVFRLPFSEAVLSSRKLYKTEEVARQAANAVTLLGMMEDKYETIDLPGQKEYTFEIIYGSVSYNELLQQSLENEAQYIRRRNSFLDHLLARFSESFSEYALVLYENTDLAASYRVMQDKAKFLSQYDSISRNRGKAYNYKLNGWNTNNVSGLENKIAAKTGISNMLRHDLCTFEVVQYEEEYGFEIKGAGKEVLFSSAEKYSSEEKATQAVKAFLGALRKSEGYTTHDSPEKNEYRLEFQYPGGVAVHPAVYASAALRDDKMKAIYSLFGHVAAEDNLAVTRYAYRNELVNHKGKAIVRSKKKYLQADKAREAASGFAQKIERQDKLKSLEITLDLRATADENRWINREALLPLFNVEGPEYRWKISGPAGLSLVSQAVFESEEEAVNGFIAFTDQKRENLSIEEGTQNGRNRYVVLDEKKEPLAWGDTTTQAEVGTLWNEYLTQRFSANWMFEQVTEAWQWELTDHGNTLLSSVRFFRHQRMAEKNWRALKDSRSKKEKTNVTIEEGEEGFFICIVDTEDEVLARSAPYEKKPENSLIERIKTLLGDEENVNYSRVDKAYGFRIPAVEEEERDVMRSYCVYPTKASAYDALQKTLAAGGRKAGYFKSGDDANLNFSFLLYDNTHRFIAMHPETYPTEEEREEALEHVVAMLKKYPAFVDTREEYVYTFRNPKGEVLCRSERSFTSLEEARAHADRWITMGVSDEYYRPSILKGGTRYGFVVTDGEEVLARNTTEFWSEAQRNEQLKELIEIFQQNTYEIHPTTLPDRWKIRYFWPDGILLESTAEYKSEEEAREAYTVLTEQIDTLEAVATDNGIAYRLPEREETVGVYPATIEKEEARTQTLEEVRQFLGTVKALRRSTEQSYQQFVYKASEHEGGTWAYRVLKKDAALAYHPGFCLEQKDTETLRQQINRLCQRAEKGYEYLELCLGGNICLEIDNKVHFLLRDKHNHTIYFISYEGYETEEEALTAFASQYLLILAKACDPDNYGSGKDIVYEWPKQSGYCPEEDTPCAIVPETTRKKFTNEELARLVCTYPVFAKKMTVKTDCRNWKTSYCYGFRLTTYIDNELHCDWKSTECYETIAEARHAFELFLILLKNKINISAQWDAQGMDMDDDCCCDPDKAKCCYRLMVKEVLLESVCKYFEETDAWKRLNKLLEEVCIEDAYYPYWDKERCCYSFYITGQDFRVARHPYAYHTPEERDAAIDALFAHCRCPEWGNIQIEVTETDDCPQAPYLFVISAANTAIWQSVHSYGTRKEAQRAGVQAMQYASEEGFYVRTSKNTWLFNKKGQHSPKDNQSFLLALHPDNTREVSELVSMSKNFPIVTRGERYGFESYCDAFEVIEEESHTKKASKEPVYRRGGVVWKSLKSFDTIEASAQAYRRFCELLGNKKNYRPETSDACGPYYIELVDMDAHCRDENGDENIREHKYSTLLAQHPQCYPKRHLLRDALERTKACMENEGMHLVEHILLRPKQQEDCRCLLPAFPDCDCELKFEAPLPDPCLPQEIDECEGVPSAALETYFPNADPYSFVVTLVLPCWTKRFRRHDFRQAFESMLLREAPAHIYFKVYWISPEQMCTFEKAYKNWIQWIAGKNICGVQNNLCEMTGILSTLEDCEPDLDTPDIPDCICDDDDDVRFNRGFLFSKYINTAKWPFASTSDDFKKALFGVSNITVLPKIDFGKIFIPKLTLPDLGGLPAVTPSALSDEEVARQVRQRMASYKNEVKEVGDKRFRKTEHFKRTEFFLSHEGQPEQYISLINEIANGLKRIKTEESRERYLALARLATAYLLDHAVRADKDKTRQPVVDALREANKLLKKQDVKESEWLHAWNAADWQDWFSSKAAADYLKKVK